MKINVSLDIMLCCLVYRYQRFEGGRCFNFRSTRKIKAVGSLETVSSFLQHYTVSHPRKQQLSSPQDCFSLAVFLVKTSVWWMERWNDAGLSEYAQWGFACKSSVWQLSDVSLMSDAADVANIQSQCSGIKVKHTEAWRGIDIFIKRITRPEPSNSHYKNTKRSPPWKFCKVQ